MINAAKPAYDRTPFKRTAASWKYRPKDNVQAPLVSIVTPFHNTGEEFAETVEAVFSQSLQVWEWIVVNDCSTHQEALARLEKLRGADPRIRIIDLPENRGPSHARNVGIQSSHAKYVFQLDSDDLIEPTAIEKLVWFLEVNTHCSFARGYEVGFGAESYLWTKGFHCGAEFLQDNAVQTNSLVRRSVFSATGGYDESIKHGYEDWDFWLRCAKHGLWGDTLPEYLHWYRRRANHADKWKDFESATRKESFRRSLLERYPGLNSDNFPRVRPRAPLPYDTPAFQPSFENPLAKSQKRLLFLVPHLEMGGADKFNLDVIRQLKERKHWEITVVSTLSASAAWYHLFTEITSDVFVLHNFLQPADFPAFFAYLGMSRGYDAILISNSIAGYQLLPLLTALFPSVPIVDYVHMEEEYWKSGGYARCSVNYHHLLDHSLVSSQHLRNWMVSRGHNADKLTVAYTNIDPLVWNRANFAPDSIVSRWNLNNEAVRILFAGRFHDQKQPEIFAQVARTILREHNDVQFLVAGDGPDRTHFEQLAAEFPSKNYRLLGALSSAEIREIMACSQIFFLPSKMEGIALVMFEAMSMGMVPVGANVGGQIELITPDCGVLIDRSGDEVQQYCDVLRRLCRDRARLAVLAANGRERVVRHHSLDALGDAVDAIFAAVISARGRVPPATNLPVGQEMARLFTLETTEQRRLDQLAQILWVERNELLARQKNVRLTECVVFVDRGQGYNEQSTIKKDVEFGRDLNVWIPIPYAISGGRLRVDPASCSGTITLSAVYLRWGSDNVAFWKAETAAELAAAIECAGTAIASVEADQYRLYAYGEDPIIYLPYVVPPTPSAPVSLQMVYRLDPGLPAKVIKQP